MTITSTGSGEILANGINGARGSAPGSVAISGGAVIEIPTGALGDYNSLRGAFESDATGTVTVSGTDTRVTLAGPGAGRVEGSRFGTGTVEILDGAEVETYWVDTARDGTGSIVVSGTGTDGQPSLLLASGDFGQFVFEGAPDPLGGFVRVGRNEGSKASLTIENGGQMRVENASDGSRDGATLDVARNAGAEGRLVVDGPGTRLVLEEFPLAPGAPPPPVDNFGAELTIGRAGSAMPTSAMTASWRSSATRAGWSSAVTGSTTPPGPRGGASW